MYLLGHLPPRTRSSNIMAVKHHARLLTLEPAAVSSTEHMTCPKRVHFFFVKEMNTMSGSWSEGPLFSIYPRYFISSVKKPGDPWSFLVSPHSCPATSAPCTAESFAQWCRSPAPPGGPQSGGWTSPSASQLADWRWHPRWAPPGCFSWDLESTWISHGFRSRRVNTDLLLCLRSGPGENVVRAFRNASDLLQNGKAPWWTPHCFVLTPAIWGWLGELLKHSWSLH